MHSHHENRLKNGTNTGKAKWEWISILENELNKKDISSEQFLHAFKSLLIIYLQNKDGNGYFNLKWTTAGRSLVNELNSDANSNIRELLFGTEDTINYDTLAGKLLYETDAIEKSKTLINPNNDSHITLTINQFTKSKSSLSSLTLTNMFKMDQFEKLHIQANQRLYQENKMLGNKLNSVKSRTEEIGAGITSKIKEIQTSSSNSFFRNPPVNNQCSLNLPQLFNKIRI
jgi:hypothetical protein